MYVTISLSRLVMLHRVSALVARQVDASRVMTLWKWTMYNLQLQQRVSFGFGAVAKTRYH
jgi:hypothetical protein